jgi:hypothetical protein
MEALADESAEAATCLSRNALAKSTGWVSFSEVGGLSFRKHAGWHLELWAAPGRVYRNGLVRRLVGRRLKSRLRTEMRGCRRRGSINFPLAVWSGRTLLFEVLDVMSCVSWSHVIYTKKEPAIVINSFYVSQVEEEESV